ncbi:MAG: HEAT repeat domain-containing protein [Myxococcales bacterium]|nr:HEAT repeat domain-containing protein [Myxococcales bacterium]
MSGWRLGPQLLVAVLLAGCASGPRAVLHARLEAGDVRGALEQYDRIRRTEGEPDPWLLGQIAAHVLEREALGDDREGRDAAFAELAMAGRLGIESAQRIAERDDRPVAQARALELLVRYEQRLSIAAPTAWSIGRALRRVFSPGHDDARERLRAHLRSDDPERFAAAILSLDPVDDEGRLRELLLHRSMDVRLRAAEQLRGAAPSTEARLALTEASRVDPEPAVRAAAVRALGAFGETAFESLRDRLTDPHPSVRLAVVGALFESGGVRAAAVVADLLEAGPSHAGVEAARRLARHGREATAARAYLLGALHAAEPTVRAQAAVALSTLPDRAAVETRLLDALSRETETTVRLQIAATLLRSARREARREAREALRAIAEAGGPPSVRAHALLAAAGRRASIRALARLLRDEDVARRRQAAGALTREARRAETARAALVDPDRLVRIRAAGGILFLAHAEA